MSTAVIIVGVLAFTTIVTVIIGVFQDEFRRMFKERGRAPKKETAQMQSDMNTNCPYGARKSHCLDAGADCRPFQQHDKLK